MQYITLMEVVRILITIVAISYIFSGMIKLKPTTYDYLKPKKFIDWADLKFAALISAPGIILHEMSHKFTSIAFGLPSEYFVSYFGLSLGVLLKLIASPFILIIPGYVTVPGTTPPLTSAIIAFAGPAINLILWIGSWLMLKYSNLNRRNFIILTATKKINMILFLFNMIPIPPLDGSKVVLGLYHTFF